MAKGLKFGDKVTFTSQEALTLPKLAADPLTGDDGDLYYNTSTANIRIYQNGGWSDLLSNGQVVGLPQLNSDPLTAANGDMYYNTAFDVIRAYLGGVWTSLGTGGGGGGGGSYTVNRFVLSSLDITNKFLTLESPPTMPSDTIVVIIGGPTQDYSVDFIVTGSTLSWNGLLLESLLTAGDVLVVQYH